MAKGGKEGGGRDGIGRRRGGAKGQSGGQARWKEVEGGRGIGIEGQRG